MYKACIFDLDGTLADSLESIAYPANLALEAVGLKPNPVESYKGFAGDGAVVMLQRSLIAAGDTELKLFDRAREVHKVTYEKHCMYKIRAFDGIEKLLDELKKRRIKIACLTNKPHNRALDVIYGMFGEGYFDFVLGQCDEIERKPSPMGALYIAEKFKVKPECCIYIGDTNTDMKTGKSAGMFTVGVTWGFRDRKELIDNHADAVIDEPLDILRFVKDFCR